MENTLCVARIGRGSSAAVVRFAAFKDLRPDISEISETLEKEVF